MRALVVSAPGRVELADVDAPAPGPGEVLVRPLASGLCGTDLEIIDGTIDPAYVRYPLVLGHEWVGRLVGGDAATVVVEGVVPDGTCEACQRGATNLCATYDEIGFTRPGALSEVVSVPERLVHRLEPGIDVMDAALTEPMSVVWRALRRVERVPGARCLVVGDGTIALLSAYLARRLSPSRVDLLGRRPAQAGLASACDVDRFLLEPTGERYDLVVEAAGQVSAVRHALASTARGATVVLLGLPAHGSRVEVAPDDLVNDDVTIEGSFSYTRAAWAEVVDMLNAGQARPSFLVTHRFGLGDWERAITTLRSTPRDDPRGKVLIDVGRASS